MGDQKEYQAEWYKLGPKEMGDVVTGEIFLSFKLQMDNEVHLIF